MRNYKHYVIRFRRRYYSNHLALEIVVILNTAKVSSRKIIAKLGFFHVLAGKNVLALNFMKLGHFLNRGVIINKRVKSILSRHLKPLKKQ